MAINIIFVWMKLPKQKGQASNIDKISFRFSIDLIHIKVKFPCRLYVEYLSSGETRKSQEIRIDQKHSVYKINEQISWEAENRKDSDEECLTVYVKLLSNKGLAFTAGIANINSKDCFAIGDSFKLKLQKSLDFDAFCECRRLQTTYPEQKSEKDIQTNRFNIVRSQLRKKQGNLSQQVQKSKVQREISSLKSQSKKEDSFKVVSIASQKAQISNKYIKRAQSSQQLRIKQKDLIQKIEYLQGELHKNNVLYEKQKQIIALLQAKQRQWTQQRLHYKTQASNLQAQVDEKRQKIRQLEGEKLRLLMNSLQLQKDIANLKQKVGSLLDKVFEKIKKLCEDKIKKMAHQFQDKSVVEQRQNDLQASFSKIIKRDKSSNNHDVYLKQAKQGQQMSKVAFSAVRGLMNKEVDQAWLQSSLGYPDHNPSSLLSNTFNDMSISDINGKVKQVSLLNSQLFLKPIQSDQLIRQRSKNKSFIEQISNKLNRLQMIIQKQLKLLTESFCEHYQRKKVKNQDVFNGQQSLLSYLEQLQTGFQKQLGALNKKDSVIAYYQQLIQQLNLTLSEKQNLVVQLQQQLYKLEQEKDQLKSELHNAYYIHSLKQQEYIKKIYNLQRGQSMPDFFSFNSSNKISAEEKDLKTLSTAYNQEIIQYKEHLRTIEKQLLHQCYDRQKLKKFLHSKKLEVQKYRVKFLMRYVSAKASHKAQFSTQDLFDTPIEQTQLRLAGHYLTQEKIV